MSRITGPISTEITEPPAWCDPRPSPHGLGLTREGAGACQATDWPARIQALTERAIDAGHTGAGYASLIEVFRGQV